MAKFKKNIWYVYAYDEEGDLCYLAKSKVADKNDNRVFNSTDDINNATKFIEPSYASYIIEQIQKDIIILTDESINPDDLKICYFVDDCVCDFKTDKQLDYYGGDDITSKPSKYNESMELHEALDILENKGYILEKTKLPEFNSSQAQEYKEMLKDFWPYYCGAVDIGKTGLSSNPKAQRRNDKIYSFLKTIFGDYTYTVDVGFNVYLQDVQEKFENDIMNENPDFLGDIPQSSRLGVYKLAKKSCPMILDYIDKMDVNAYAKKFIEKD